MRTGALGMVETRGMLGAIEAADTALKSASVSLIGSRKVGGGLVTILITGDVAAVRTAVDAACASLGRLNVEFSAHVIPRLDPEVWAIVEAHGNRSGSGPVKPLILGACRQEAIAELPLMEVESPDAEPVPYSGGEGMIGEKGGAEELPRADREAIVGQLRAMTVADLRRLAREVALDSLTRRQIRETNKRELVVRLSAFFERAAEKECGRFQEKMGQVLSKKRGDKA